MEWKNLPLLDQDLVKFLRKKYPPVEYKQGESSVEFTNEAIFRGGQIEVINTIEHIISLQTKGKTNATRRSGI